MIVSWWQRVGIAYVILYCLPGPVEMLPGGASIGEAFEAGERAIVVPAGRWLFGLTLTIFPRGSGDTTYNYVELVVQLALAAIIGTAWHGVRRGRPVSPRTRDHVTMFIRFMLGGIMLSYGWAKLIPVQMPAPGPERLVGTVGDMSPMALLWTFMGASLPYQMFAGFAEALGGVLLFWRRTTLLGALILCGALVNVVALNFCYDVPVKLYSSHLLGMAVVLVAPHLPRLANLLVLNRPIAAVELQPFPPQRPWVRRTALAAKVVIVLFYGVGPMVTGYQVASTYGFLAPRHALGGVYRVTAFTPTGDHGGAPLDGGPRRWVRIAVSASGTAMVLARADGSKGVTPLTIDPERRVWTFPTSEDGAVRLEYRVADNGVVTLDGPIGTGPVQVVLTPEGESQLLGRGFHWINEVPFNRWIRP